MSENSESTDVINYYGHEYSIDSGISSKTESDIANYIKENVFHIPPGQNVSISQDIIANIIIEIVYGNNFMNVGNLYGIWGENNTAEFITNAFNVLNNPKHQKYICKKIDDMFKKGLVVTEGDVATPEKCATSLNSSDNIDGLQSYLAACGITATLQDKAKILEASRKVVSDNMRSLSNENLSDNACLLLSDILEGRLSTNDSDSVNLASSHMAIYNYENNISERLLSEMQAALLEIDGPLISNSKTLLKNGSGCDIKNLKKIIENKLSLAIAESVSYDNINQYCFSHSKYSKLTPNRELSITIALTVMDKRLRKDKSGIIGAKYILDLFAEQSGFYAYDFKGAEFHKIIEDVVFILMNKRARREIANALEADVSGFRVIEGKDILDIVKTFNMDVIDVNRLREENSQLDLIDIVESFALQVFPDDTDSRDNLCKVLLRVSKDVFSDNLPAALPEVFELNELDESLANSINSLMHVFDENKNKAAINNFFSDLITIKHTEKDLTLTTKNVLIDSLKTTFMEHLKNLGESVIQLNASFSENNKVNLGGSGDNVNKNTKKTAEYYAESYDINGSRISRQDILTAIQRSMHNISTDKGLILTVDPNKSKLGPGKGVFSAIKALVTSVFKVPRKDFKIYLDMAEERHPEVKIKVKAFEFDIKDLSGDFSLQDHATQDCKDNPDLNSCLQKISQSFSENIQAKNSYSRIISSGGGTSTRKYHAKTSADGSFSGFFKGGDSPNARKEISEEKADVTSNIRKTP
ncbi:MAG: hypothetical protein VX335_04330 [Pseudomonadota bacterium]|nr:hypothetical protein [Pseudomonadota bacterium]